MAKQAAPGKPSPFDALRIARLQQETAETVVPVGPVAGTAVQMVKRPDSQMAKSVDPEYMKFTTYVRKTTHLAVKSRLVAQQRELSDLVEELLTKWLEGEGRR